MHKYCFICVNDCIANKDELTFICNINVSFVIETNSLTCGLQYIPNLINASHLSK